MVANTDIKYFAHTNNAPQLQNTYGSMIGVLDACLVNGVSLGPVSTLTAVGTTVTAVFSTAHNLMQYQVLKIAGANQAEYNGEHRILTVPNATSVTFQLASAPSVTKATGSMTASLPPLGWEKPFSSGNEAGGGKAAYRSKNTLLISRPFLRVVDELDPAYSAAYAKYAKVGIVEDMTDINTMLAVQAPFDAANPTKNWISTGTGVNTKNGWAKWFYSFYSNTDGTSLSDPNASDVYSPQNGARAYYVIGNTDSFILAVRTGLSENHGYSIYGFGKYQSFFDGDAFNDYLAAHLYNQTVNWVTNERASYAGLSNSRISDCLCLSRNLANSAVNSYGVASVDRLSTSGQSNVAQSAANLGQLIYCPVNIWTENVFRGQLPFIRWVYQAQPAPNHSKFIDANEIYLALNTEFGSREKGQVFLKIGDL